MTDSILGWMAIGAAASLAGMIWPFRRGSVGVLVNLVAGIVGASVLALVAHVMMRPEQGRGGLAQLFFAAVGSLASIGLVRHVRGRPGA